MDIKKLTHINEKGDAHMVDVSNKAETSRMAIAKGFISMKKETFETITSNSARKGDVLATARIAGIMAAKKTSDLIPLCHPLSLTKVELELNPLINENDGEKVFGIEAKAICSLVGKTGVEMESLTAVSVACLTIYDMCKAIDRSMTIENIRMVHKSGGKSGNWNFT